MLFRLDFFCRYVPWLMTKASANLEHRRSASPRGIKFNFHDWIANRVSSGFFPIFYRANWYRCPSPHGEWADSRACPLVCVLRRYCLECFKSVLSKLNGFLNMSINGIKLCSFFIFYFFCKNIRGLMFTNKLGGQPYNSCLIVTLSLNRIPMKLISANLAHWWISRVTRTHSHVVNKFRHKQKCFSIALSAELGLWTRLFYFF